MQELLPGSIEHAANWVFGILTTGSVLGALLVWHRQGQNIKLEREKRLDAERKNEEDRKAGNLNAAQVEITRRLQLELDAIKAQATMYREYAGDMAKLLEQARVDQAAVSAQLAQSMQQLADGRELQYETKRHLDKCKDDLNELRDDYAELASTSAAQIAELSHQVQDLHGNPAT